MQILDIEDSQVGEGSSELAPHLYTCNFIMEGATFLSNDCIRPWLDRHGGKWLTVWENALLLPTDMENWKVMDGE